MDKIILKDNTEIEVTAMQSIGSITTTVANGAAIDTLKAHLSSGNLSKVKIQNAAGDITGEYTDMVLMEPWSIRWDADEQIAVTFGLRAKNDTEKILEMLKTHDGAITDLAAAISEAITGGVK